MATARARLSFSHNDRVATITLDAPKANIVDCAMIADIGRHLDSIAERWDLVAVVIGASGPHFSFGASVEEHLPDNIGATLAALHGLLRRLGDLPVPTIAAVHGLCLGGAFEVALGCDLIVAAEGAQFGCPEIKLGVFPPAASALLPVKIGAAGAAALVLTGATISTAQAESCGLVARVLPATSFDEALASFLAETFESRSPVALRFAAVAARQEVRRALQVALPEAERLYLDDLMAHPDPVEGIRAFLEKRSPQWQRGEGAPMAR